VLFSYSPYKAFMVPDSCRSHGNKLQQYKALT